MLTTVMELLIGTSNEHKVREIREVLEPLGLRVDGLDALANPPEEPVEDGLSFADNARIKARAYAQSTGRMCLADDSGLVVDALDGRPGIRSARYAGVGSTRNQRDQANNAKLLAELEGMPAHQRSARFVCAMCLAQPDGDVLAETEATFEGVIGDAPRGENGFGYDPLLFIPELGCTSAELAPEQKNARSHRGRAVRAMAKRMVELGLTDRST